MANTAPAKWYRKRTYLGYGIACIVAWAIIWALVASLARTATVHAFALVFLGWVIGWGSATLARAVYPPPTRTLFNARRRRGSDDSVPG